jgi:uncharacterized membrane protein
MVFKRPMDTLHGRDFLMRKKLTCWCFWLQVTLFSGFVSYQMVREAYEGHFTVSFLFLIQF